MLKSVRTMGNADVTVIKITIAVIKLYIANEINTKRTEGMISIFYFFKIYISSLIAMKRASKEYFTNAVLAR